MAGIYIIENNFNGMVYVGRSEIPEARFKQHKNALMKGKHTNHLLQADYSKYGDEAFSFMVIERCGDEEMWLREIVWIQHYRTCNIAPIYNDLGKTVENIDIEARLGAIERIRAGLRERMNR
jgi:group I intron endonuclease